MTAANRGDLKPGLRLVHGPWSWSALLGTVGTSSAGEKGTRPHDGILIIKLLTAEICARWGGGINDRIRQWLGVPDICKRRTQTKCETEWGNGKYEQQ